MPSKESLDKALPFCTCTGWPEGTHGPNCYAPKVADLLDEAIRGARRTAQEDVAAGFQACYMFDQKLSVEEVCRVIRANVERERLTQLREGKT